MPRLVICVCVFSTNGDCMMNQLNFWSWLTGLFVKYIWLSSFIFSAVIMERLEKVQRHAACFISRDYKSRETRCVTKMPQEHNLPPLQQRRKEIRLALFYKIANGSLPGLPAAEYLTPTRNKRLIKATKFDGCVSRNVVENHQTRHSRCFQTPRGTSEVFRNSFLPRTTCEWNSLEEAQVNCSTLDGFKISLQRRI